VNRWAIVKAEDPASEEAGYKHCADDPGPAGRRRYGEAFPAMNRWAIFKGRFANRPYVQKTSGRRMTKMPVFQ
jgi:hypothetical protein